MDDNTLSAVIIVCNVVVIIALFYFMSKDN